MASKLHKFKQTSLGALFNVYTNRIIKYNKTNVNNILKKLESQYSKGNITKIEYNKLIKEYNNKVKIETEANCFKKNKLICTKNVLVKSKKKKDRFHKIQKNVCVKDNIKNRLLCGIMLSEDQFDSLIKEQKEKECTRKNTDYQYTEYLFAILLKNPELEFDLEAIKKVDNINLNATQKKRFLKDLHDSYPDEMVEMKKWFKNAKAEINNLYKLYPELIKIDNVEVFLTGKNITEEKLKKYLDKSVGRDKINKGDVYLLCGDKFLGFSIKKSNNATLLNWGIEGQIKKLDEKIFKKFTEIKKEFFMNIGIDLDNRVSHKLVRSKFNSAMKGDNIYKNFIRSVIETDEKYFLHELVKGIGANTSYPTYMFSGGEMVNLNNIYKDYTEKLDKNKLRLLSDNIKNNPILETYGLKEHYSNNAGKIWYYINDDGKFNYRIEIRTKGNCYASLQFQLHKC